MKNMKKFVTVLLLGLMIIGLAGCSKEETDAIKFKKEYESYNGTINEKNGKEYRTLSISKENPIVYATAEEISKKIENKDSFYVYFGFSTCPWCRSMIEQLLKCAEDHNVKQIYYVDVLDIRDIKEVGEDNTIKTTREGDEYYLKLLDQLKEVLSDYSLTDSEGNPVEVGEKRIYAPNVVAISNGVAQKLSEGIAEGLEDPYAELTEEMKQDSYNQLDCIFKCLEESTMCTKTSC